MTTCFFHKWGPWRTGTHWETFNGVRTGRSSQAIGRECVRCGQVQHKPR